MCIFPEAIQSDLWSDYGKIFKVLIEIFIFQKCNKQNNKSKVGIAEGNYLVLVKYSLSDSYI
jgi:hypothetical protein